MLILMRIKSFRRFPNADIELDPAVASTGPNDSGKITALQALGLWGVGLRTRNAE